MKNEQAYISQLKKGIRFTTDKSMALRAAMETGRIPLDFISIRVKDAYKKAYPELLKKQKRAKTNQRGKYDK